MGIKCKEKNCTVRPSFNNQGETKRLYCFKHKKEGMINVNNHKMCIDCNVRASFNVKGEKNPLYCSKHKKQGMIDITAKKCVDCDVQPSFNNQGETKPLYCFTHKKEGMIDVKSKTCIECKKQPCFNTDSNTKAIYCADHKKEGMIDVKHKTCLECDVIPSFNNQGEKNGLYCNKHKKNGMINVKSKTCLECDVISNFNNQGETKPLYCLTHKKEGMIDVKHKTCISDWCSTRFTNKKYDGYCLRCFIYLFPDKPVSRNYKTKEYSVLDFIKTKFPELDFIADKIISGGCSRRRPDLILDMLYQIIIIEIDENQHTDYNCSCENKRLMELSQDLGHRPIVFIRFNPDDYKKDGKNITSCWGCDKNGICVVKKSKQKEWLERLNTLEDQIKYWTCPENMTDKTIETIHLYYDM
jgi:ferredoxin-like protein FixX